VETTPVQLLPRRKGWLAIERILSTDDGLTDAEFEAWMQRLQMEVAPQFQHLRFWPD